jgi:hypothetical protein
LKIRLKVKHLAMLIVAIGISLPLANALDAPSSESAPLSGESVADRTNIAQWKKQIRQAIDTADSPKRKWELIKDHMIVTRESSFAFGFDVYVGSNFSQVNGDGTEQLAFSLSEKQPYLEDYLAHAPPDDFLVHAAKQIAYYYDGENLIGPAITALELAEKRLSGGKFAYAQNNSAFERARLYAGYDQLDKADAVMKKLWDQPDRPDFDLAGRMVLLQTQILVRKDGVQNAVLYIEREIEAYTKAWVEAKKKDGGTGGGGEPAMLARIAALKDQLLTAANHNAVTASSLSGTIKRSDGVPLAHAGVFLREQKDVHHSVTEGEPYQTMTNKNGEFTFKGVLPGSYQLFLGLTFRQIDGWTWPVSDDEWIDIKGDEDLNQQIVFHPLMELISPVNQQAITGKTVHFEWEKVTGAAYYQLTGDVPIRNGIIGSVLASHIKDNRIELPVEALYDAQRGLSAEDFNNWLTTSPATLLGFTDPGNRYAWGVEAYDAEGRLLTKSKGYRLDPNTIGNLPFFFLKERTMVPADRMVTEGRLEEALEAYKKTLAGNPVDVHSLRMIIGLLEAKASAGPAEALDDEITGLVKRMVELNPAESYVSRLLDAYYKREQWNDVKDMYILYSRISSGVIPSYMQASYAASLMRQGKLKEAREQFAAATAKDNSHRFVGNYLAVTLHGNRDYAEALAIADKYPERSFDSHGPDWAAMVQRIKIEAESSEAYSSELDQKLIWYFQGEKEKLNAWSRTTTDTGIKALMQALLEID